MQFILHVTPLMMKQLKKPRQSTLSLFKLEECDDSQPTTSRANETGLFNKNIEGKCRKCYSVQIKVETNIEL